MPRIFPRYILLITLGSLVVGSLYVLPELLIWKNVKDTGHFFTLRQFTELSDEVHGYFPRAKEVADGHLPPGDIFLNPNGPTPLNPLPPLLFGSLIFLFGDLIQAHIVAQFIFPILIYLLFVWLGREIFDGHKTGSVVFGLVGVLTPIVMVLPYAFFGIDNFLNTVVKNFYPLVETRLDTLFFARLDYPLLVYPFYLTAIVFLIKFWRDPTRRKIAVGTGLSAATLLYVYFHVWVYWVVVLGLIGIVCALLSRQNMEYIKGFLWLAATFLIGSLPYGINYLKFVNLSSSSDYVWRIGIESGRVLKSDSVPHFIAYFVLAILVYFFYFRKGLFLKAYLFWSFIAGAFVVWDVQFLLGYTIHSDHWPRAISPIVFVMLCGFLNELGRSVSHRKLKANKFLTTAMIVISLLVVSKKIVNIISFYVPDDKTMYSHSLPYNLKFSWEWLDKSTNVREPRVLSPSFLTSTYLISFTSSRPFLATANLSLADNNELEKRYLLANKVFGVENEVLKAKISMQNVKERCVRLCEYFNSEKNLLDDPIYLYANYFRSAPFPDYVEGSRRFITRSKVIELMARYDQLEVKLDDIEADYIFWGPWEKQFSRAGPMNQSQLRLVYQNPEVSIFKIIKSRNNF